MYNPILASFREFGETVVSAIRHDRFVNLFFDLFNFELIAIYIFGTTISVSRSADPFVKEFDIDPHWS